MTKTLPPFRRVVQFAAAIDINPHDGTRRRVVRMRLECHHVIYRHDETAHAEQPQRCRDCQRGIKPKGLSKAALERWGL